MTTILVVDDDRQMRTYVAETLEYAGYEIITALDAPMGIQKAEEKVPDIIISDVNMPNMNGYQMLERLRSLPKTSGIPVIFLTGESSPDAQRKGMTQGAEDYLPKPASPQDILTSVKVQLGKRAALAEKHDSTMRMLRKNIIYALPHELRTPLTIISGYAGLIEMDEGKGDAEEILSIAQSITKATKRLESLIENYLIYAQLELLLSDPAELEAARNHIVKDVASIIGSAAKNKADDHKRGSDLQLDLVPIALRISEQNLRKIITELVDNAFKFSAPGSEIVIKSERRNDQLIIQIRDRGRGMTNDQVDLMGAYMQFERTLYEQQGLGLGFIVAKRLVELHGGAVKIVSVPEKGTVVSLRFSLY